MIGALLAMALTAPAGFVALDDVDATIVQDMRYATAYNFVGRRIDGYRDPVCILHRRAARALRRAQTELGEQGYTLKVYDCYRPQRAVDHFVRWSQNGNQRMKREFYPRVDKARVFDLGYIARRSGHSRGSTVDLTLYHLATGDPAPMGGDHDLMDSVSHHGAEGITPVEASNRRHLRSIMESSGFIAYEPEWWHYTLQHEPFTNTYFDFPIA